MALQSSADMSMPSYSKFLFHRSDRWDVQLVTALPLRPTTMSGTDLGIGVFQVHAATPLLSCLPADWRGFRSLRQRLMVSAYGLGGAPSMVTNSVDFTTTRKWSTFIFAFGNSVRTAFQKSVDMSIATQRTRWHQKRGLYMTQRSTVAPHFPSTAATLVPASVDRRSIRR